MNETININWCQNDWYFNNHFVLMEYSRRIYNYNPICWMLWLFCICMYVSVYPSVRRSIGVLFRLSLYRNRQTSVNWIVIKHVLSLVRSTIALKSNEFCTVIMSISLCWHGCPSVSFAFASLFRASVCFSLFVCVFLCESICDNGYCTNWSKHCA